MQAKIGKHMQIATKMLKKVAKCYIKKIELSKNASILYPSTKQAHLLH